LGFQFGHRKANFGSHKEAEEVDVIDVGLKEKIVDRRNGCSYSLEDNELGLTWQHPQSIHDSVKMTWQHP